jgi:hypothetical protein
MAVQNAENVLRRKVSRIFLSQEDWRRKVSQSGSFVSKVAALTVTMICDPRRRMPADALRG